MKFLHLISYLVQSNISLIRPVKKPTECKAYESEGNWRRCPLKSELNGEASIAAPMAINYFEYP